MEWLFLPPAKQNVAAIEKKKSEKCDKSKTITTDMLLTSLQDSLIKNKKQTAMINILNLHKFFDYMTWRFVCTLHTFSNETAKI